MPTPSVGQYSRVQLDDAANQIAAYAERVRAVVLVMQERGVENLDVSNDAAFVRAITELKRWSRGVEDAMDEWWQSTRVAIIDSGVPRKAIKRRPRGEKKE